MKKGNVVGRLTLIGKLFPSSGRLQREAPLYFGVGLASKDRKEDDRSSPESRMVCRACSNRETCSYASVLGASHAVLQRDRNRQHHHDAAPTSKRRQPVRPNTATRFLYRRVWEGDQLDANVLSAAKRGGAGTSRGRTPRASLPVKLESILAVGNPSAGTDSCFTGGAPAGKVWADNQSQYLRVEWPVRASTRDWREDAITGRNRTPSVRRRGRGRDQ